MNRLTFSAPWPPRGLHPNDHALPMPRHRAAVRYRRVVALCAREALGAAAPPRWPFVAVDLEFRVPDRRRRDVDNLLAAFKAGLDGICDAGLAVADDSEHLALGSAEVLRVPGCRPEVVVTVREDR